MQGASRTDPLLQDFQPFVVDPRAEWGQTAQVVGARAAALVDDYPIAAAMVIAKLQGTHGADGMRFRSLYARDDAPDTDAGEEQTRRQIDAYLRAASPWVDAGGVLSCREVDWSLDAWATIYGDGYAIRVVQPGRPGAPLATAFRLVHPWRVRNPKNEPNNKRLIDGHAFDEQGRPSGIYIEVEPEAIPRFAMSLMMPIGGETFFVPWNAPDGTPNVLHRRGLSKPTAVRGISCFAPMILTARLLQGVEVAYVATKRVHASHPLTIEVEDIEKAREQYAGTKIANLLVGRDHKVTFNSHKFEGADFAEFVNAELRNMCASWGLPYELVVGDHSAKSGASSRSLWQQYWQRCAVWQADAIDQVNHRRDRAILAEGMASGALALGDDWPLNMRGRYTRPPRIMPDPLKEAQAAQLWIEIGRSRTGVFADVGMDYVEETMQRHQDDILRDAQDIGGDEPAPPADDADEPDAMAVSALDMAGAVASVAAALRSPAPASVAPVVHAHITMPEQSPATVQNHVHVEPTPVHIQVEPTPVANHVHVPQARNDIHLPKGQAPIVTVNVPESPAPVVNVSVPSPQTVARPLRAVQNEDGSVTIEPVEG
jgi:capsid protein